MRALIGLVLVSGNVNGWALTDEECEAMEHSDLCQVTVLDNALRRALEGGSRILKPVNS